MCTDELKLQRPVAGFYRADCGSCVFTGPIFRERLKTYIFMWSILTFQYLLKTFKLGTALLLKTLSSSSPWHSPKFLPPVSDTPHLLFWVLLSSPSSKIRVSRIPFSALSTFSTWATSPIPWLSVTCARFPNPYPELCLSLQTLSPWHLHIIGISN